MKRGVWIALLLLLVGFGGAYVWYRNQLGQAGKEPYGTALKPRLELAAYSITNITDERADMNLSLVIDNPLPVTFKARKLDYKIYIDSALVAEDTYPKGLQVEARDCTLIQLPVQVYLKKLAKVLKTLEDKSIDSVRYRIRTTFDLDLPIMGERTFTIDTSKVLPAYYIPKIKLEEIDLGKLGLKRTDLAMRVTVVNKNGFPYRFRDTRYTVSVDGDILAEGRQPETIRIAKNAETPVVFPVTLRPNKIDNLLWKTLFEKNDTPYEIRFSCRIDDAKDNKSFENSLFQTRIVGTLADLKGGKK